MCLAESPACVVMLSIVALRAAQVERFACLYTSHVSNLHFYSPDKCYRCAALLCYAVAALAHDSMCFLLGCVHVSMPRGVCPCCVLCRGRMDHMAHEEESVFEEAAACLLPRNRHSTECL